MWDYSLVHSRNTSGYLLLSLGRFACSSWQSQGPALMKLLVEWGRQGINKYVLCQVAMNAVKENEAR